MDDDDYPYIKPLPLNSGQEESSKLNGETLIWRGQIAFVACSLICIWGLYAIGFGSFLPSSGIPVRVVKFCVSS